VLTRLTQCLKCSQSNVVCVGFVWMKFQKIVSAADVDDIECPQYGTLYFAFRWILDLQITM